MLLYRTYKLIADDLVVCSFGKNPDALARRRLVEVKNGRLAMIGFGGMLHQQLLFKQGTIEQLANFKAIAQ